MSSEFSNVCRLCAGSSNNFILIFENAGLTNFAEKIKFYLHVDIKNSKNPEPRMCHTCYEKIVSWDQYVEQVQKVQGMFTTLIRKDSMNSSVENMKEIDVEAKTMEPSVSNAITNDSSTQTAREVKTREKYRGVKKKKRKKMVLEGEIYKTDIYEENDISLQTDSVETRRSRKNRLNQVEKLDLKRETQIKRVKLQDASIEAEEERNKGGEQENEDDEEEQEAFEGKKLQPLFTWECLECRVPVKNWSALVKHCKEEHRSNASVQCVCGKFLQSRDSIMKHRMTHIIGYGYKCAYENCNKTFHRRQLLDIHSLSHMPKEQQPWMCCKCSRRFHTESLLKQHEKIHLPKEEKLVHPCQVCQKRFCSKSAVSAHVRAVHFGERPFVCDQCGHSFTSKGILHEHLTIHSDVCNFHCKDCNKSFKTKYRLKIHMDTHVSTRYQCPTCNLTLNTRRTLRMHLLVHKDDRAFKCSTCGKAFKRSKDLKNHCNLHTGRRPYTCLFCQRTFANGSNCRSHKRRMHPEELKMYEAAVATGQPVDILQLKSMVSSTTGNETPTGESDAKRKTRKSSNDVSLIYNLENSPSEENPEDNTRGSNIDNSMEVKSENHSEGTNAVKNENGEEKIGKNVAQSSEIGNESQLFANQSASFQFPVSTFQFPLPSQRIPAFPGNPFSRQ